MSRQLLDLPDRIRGDRVGAFNTDDGRGFKHPLALNRGGFVGSFARAFVAIYQNTFADCVRRNQCALEPVVVRESAVRCLNGRDLSQLDVEQTGHEWVLFPGITASSHLIQLGISMNPLRDHRMVRKQNEATQAAAKRS